MRAAYRWINVITHTHSARQENSEQTERGLSHLFREPVSHPAVRFATPHAGRFATSLARSQLARLVSRLPSHDATALAVARAVARVSQPSNKPAVA